MTSAAAAAQFVPRNRCYDCVMNDAGREVCQNLDPGETGKALCTESVQHSSLNQPVYLCTLAGPDCFKTPDNPPQAPPEPENNCQAGLLRVPLVQNGEIFPGWTPPEPLPSASSLEG
ncbi:MAG: hypothetical protein AAGD06_23260 [Acidobacteriota bacterium]